MFHFKDIKFCEKFIIFLSYFRPKLYRPAAAWNLRPQIVQFCMNINNFSTLLFCVYIICLYQPQIVKPKFEYLNFALKNSSVLYQAFSEPQRLLLVSLSNTNPLLSRCVNYGQGPENIVLILLRAIDVFPTWQVCFFVECFFPIFEIAVFGVVPCTSASYLIDRVQYDSWTHRPHFFRRIQLLDLRIIQMRKHRFLAVLLQHDSRPDLSIDDKIFTLADKYYGAILYENVYEEQTDETCAHRREKDQVCKFIPFIVVKNLD